MLSAWVLTNLSTTISTNNNKYTDSMGKFFFLSNLAHLQLMLKDIFIVEKILGGHVFFVLVFCIAQAEVNI